MQFSEFKKIIALMKRASKKDQSGSYDVVHFGSGVIGVPSSTGWSVSFNADIEHNDEFGVTFASLNLITSTKAPAGSDMSVRVSDDTATFSIGEVSVAIPVVTDRYHEAVELVGEDTHPVWMHLPDSTKFSAAVSNAVKAFSFYSAAKLPAEAEVVHICTCDMPGDLSDHQLLVIAVDSRNIFMYEEPTYLARYSADRSHEVNSVYRNDSVLVHRTDAAKFNGLLAAKDVKMQVGKNNVFVVAEDRRILFPIEISKMYAPTDSLIKFIDGLEFERDLITLHTDASLRKLLASSATYGPHILFRFREDGKSSVFFGIDRRTGDFVSEHELEADVDKSVGILAPSAFLSKVWTFMDNDILIRFNSKFTMLRSGGVTVVASTRSDR